jgi:hypothetical protein
VPPRAPAPQDFETVEAASEVMETEARYSLQLDGQRVMADYSLGGGAGAGAGGAAGIMDWVCAMCSAQNFARWVWWCWKGQEGGRGGGGGGDLVLARGQRGCRAPESAWRSRRAEACPAPLQAPGVLPVLQRQEQRGAVGGRRARGSNLHPEGAPRSWQLAAGTADSGRSPLAPPAPASPALLLPLL